ncbi:profilin-like [Panulirus ornatus]|uniref:profilin-like n=1 Tax=Panulirus ornatus TaxID=150431 RepID=UPI003A8C5262
MSWNTYVENLEKTGFVQKAAVCGQDGSVWAVSAGWDVTPAEVKKLSSSFNDKEALSQSGMHIGNEKFFYLGGEENELKGKKGQAGIHVAKSKTAIIIGYYEQPIQHCQCAKEVYNVAMYLKELQY